MQEQNRDHLFISYAWEDEALAEWLCLKLTSEGYRVWCDRFKLLGGESYPQDIDDSIKYRTFRLIALLSRFSISKPNPTKERTLALNIARDRNIDFLIPLNLDGLKPTELNWMISDLTFIPFDESWAEGLKKLLKKLESINAPMPLKNGKQIAAETFFPKEIISNSPETIHTNLLKFIQIPEAIKRFQLNRKLEKGEKEFLSKSWAFYQIDKNTVLSFHSPQNILHNNLIAKYNGGSAWQLVKEIDGIKTINVVTNLLKKSLITKCLGNGLEWSKDHHYLYFPKGLMNKDKIIFKDYYGKKTWLLAVSERKNRQQANKLASKYRYHLSPTFKIMRNINEEILLRLKVRLYITWDNGEPMLPRSALSRRKNICKYWYNHEWLNKLLAICQFLSEGEETITIGELPNEKIVISSNMLKFTAPFGINEELLAKKPIYENLLGSFDFEEIGEEFNKEAEDEV